MNSTNNDIALVKALLLSKATVQLSDSISDIYFPQKGNFYQKEWIFIRLNANSRVRLTISENAEHMIELLLDGTYQILDTTTGSVIIMNVHIESTLVHAPDQLFFALYKKCSAGCKFCPLATYMGDEHSSLNKIYSRIKNIEQKKIRSISLTSSLPESLSTSDIVDEMIFLIKKIREVVTVYVPIGISVITPSKEDLQLLKRHGVSEVRLNLEIYNEDISQSLMPKKDEKIILQSIQDACEIFGKGYVSSNIIVGLGESDADVLNGVEVLARMGAVATLYPYDTIENQQKNFTRPSAERLHSLAIEQKKIFDRYNINTNKLQTMCGACTAGFILPGKDC